jgi:hypothetical protein
VNGLTYTFGVPCVLGTLAPGVHKFGTCQTSSQHQGTTSSTYHQGSNHSATSVTHLPDTFPSHFHRLINFTALPKGLTWATHCPIGFNQVATNPCLMVKLLWMRTFSIPSRAWYSFVHVRRPIPGICRQFMKALLFVSTCSTAK